MATITSIVPAARFKELVTSEIGDEVLVYDEASHHIHQLNQVSATVWRLCNGRRSVADLAHETGMTAELVQVALGKLADAMLLDGDLPAGVQSRRRFLKKAALAGGVALPVLVSVSAPTAVQASSHCGAINAVCGLGDFPSCCSGSFCYNNRCVPNGCIQLGGSCAPQSTNCCLGFCHPFNHVCTL
jgi:hypothetical protein